MHSNGGNFHILKSFEERAHHSYYGLKDKNRREKFHCQTSFTFSSSSISLKVDKRGNRNCLLNGYTQKLNYIKYKWSAVDEWVVKAEEEEGLLIK